MDPLADIFAPDAPSLSILPIAQPTVYSRPILPSYSVGSVLNMEIIQLVLRVPTHRVTNVRIEIGGKATYYQVGPTVSIPRCSLCKAEHRLV